MTNNILLDNRPLDDTLLDDDGHLICRDDWNETIAQSLADTLDICLTDEHWAILFATQRYYQQFGHSPATRPLIKFLNQQLPTLTITNAKLQALFKTGLVARHINRLAGLPKPANCL